MGTVLAEGGAGSAEHGAELHRVRLSRDGRLGFRLPTPVCVSVASLAKVSSSAQMCYLDS